MSLEETPIYFALALSLIGMASPTWRNLHRAMLLIYIVTIGFTELYFSPINIPRIYLPYAGAFLSGLSAIYLSFFCNLYPEDITHKRRLLISISTILIMILFISEAIASWYAGYVFNHVDEKHYFLMEIYSPFMLWSTILQSIILITGGIDGRKRISSVVSDWINNSSWNFGTYKNNIRSNERHQQRDL